MDTEINILRHFSNSAESSSPSSAPLSLDYLRDLLSDVDSSTKFLIKSVGKILITIKMLNLHFSEK